MDNQSISFRNENPPPTNPTPTTLQSNESHQNNRLIKSIYLILAVLLIYFLLTIVDTTILHYKIESAVVSAPNYTALSPIKGQLISVMPAGSTVKKNQAVARLDAFEINQERELASIAVQSAQLTVSAEENRLKNEYEKVKLYSTVSQSKISHYDKQLSLLKEEKELAQRNLERYRMLHEKRYISDILYEGAKKNYIASMIAFNNAVENRQSETNASSNLTRGLYFTGSKIEGDKVDITKTLEEAKSQLALAKRKLALIDAAYQRTIIKAPFDAKIVKQYYQTSDWVDPYHPILILEPLHTDKKITAFLTENELAHINPKSSVRILIPSTNEVFNGAITNIDRSESFFGLSKSPLTYRDLYDEKTAVITIELNHAERLKFNSHYSSGIPAFTYLKRQWI